MQEQVTAFIKKHHLIDKDATVLLGISGGPDSMALMHYFRSIRSALNLNLIVISANHQLRGEEGRRDLEYVQDMCNEWGITFIGTSLNVEKYKRRKKVGTQVAARELRYEFFAKQMREHEADYLALGHHGDDQIETMLMELVRQADSSSFSGMPVKRSFAGGLLIRPLLAVAKDEIESYCQENGIAPRIDPSNQDTFYTRNYFRKNVIPKLKKKNGNLHRTIQYLSESLHDDERYLKQEAEKAVSKAVIFHENERKVSLSAKVFKSYPTALQRRSFHLILNYLYNKLPGNLSYIHEHHFLKLLETDGNITIDFPHDLKVQKAYDNVTFSFCQSFHSQNTSFHEVLNIPGKIRLPDGKQIVAEYITKQESEAVNTFVIPANIKLPLHVRTRQAGDRMSWKGLNGSRKIKDVFIDEKIPMGQRQAWPLITDDEGTILWLAGLRKKQLENMPSNDLFIKLTYER